MDEAKKALQAISADLKTIQAQAPQMKGSLKGQLETANAAFKTSPATGLLEHHIGRVADQRGNGDRDRRGSALIEPTRRRSRASVLTRPVARMASAAARAGAPARVRG